LFLFEINVPELKLMVKKNAIGNLLILKRLFQN